MVCLHGAMDPDTGARVKASIAESQNRRYRQQYVALGQTPAAYLAQSPSATGHRRSACRYRTPTLRLNPLNIDPVAVLHFPSFRLVLRRCVPFLNLVCLYERFSGGERLGSRRWDGSASQITARLGERSVPNGERSQREPYQHGCGPDRRRAAVLPQAPAPQTPLPVSVLDSVGVAGSAVVIGRVYALSPVVRSLLVGCMHCRRGPSAALSARLLVWRLVSVLVVIGGGVGRCRC